MIARRIERNQRTVRSAVRFFALSHRDMTERRKDGTRRAFGQPRPTPSNRWGCLLDLAFERALRFFNGRLPSAQRLAAVQS